MRPPGVIYLALARSEEAWGPSEGRGIKPKGSRFCQVLGMNGWLGETSGRCLLKEETDLKDPAD